MAKIARVDIWMIDLQPEARRTDAIQSFVCQETPTVRIADADGASGIGYSYTIGTGGTSLIELLRRTLAPALIGCEDVRRLSAVRDALGDGFEIMTDANPAFDVDEVIRWGTVDGSAATVA
jgi:L-alanine-DL-glutamate epimerase-like enolase superfamily enzyme